MEKEYTIVIFQVYPTISWPLQLLTSCCSRSSCSNNHVRVICVPFAGCTCISLSPHSFTSASPDSSDIVIILLFDILPWRTWVIYNKILHFLSFASLKNNVDSLLSTYFSVWDKSPHNLTSTEALPSVMVTIFLLVSFAWIMLETYKHSKGKNKILLSFSLYKTLYY